MAVKVTKTLLAVCAAWLIATGCATKRQSGALAGGAVGAGVGHAIGDTPGLLIGGALGALIGHEVGAELDRQDRERAARALEYNASHETTTWVNPDSGYEYQLTPTETYYPPEPRYAEPNQPCREFRMLVDMRGQAEEVYGTACRQPDGSWEIVST